VEDGVDVLDGLGCHPLAVPEPAVGEQRLVEGVELQRFLDAIDGQPAELLGSGWREAAVSPPPDAARLGEVGSFDVVPAARGEPRPGRSAAAWWPPCWSVAAAVSPPPAHLLRRPGRPAAAAERPLRLRCSAWPSRRSGPSVRPSRIADGSDTRTSQYLRRRTPATTAGLLGDCGRASRPDSGSRPGPPQPTSGHPSAILRDGGVPRAPDVGHFRHSTECCPTVGLPGGQSPARRRQVTADLPAPRSRRPARTKSVFYPLAGSWTPRRSRREHDRRSARPPIPSGGGSPASPGSRHRDAAAAAISQPDGRVVLAAISPGPGGGRPRRPPPAQPRPAWRGCWRRARRRSWG
jgi:hypothetical protein